MGWEWRGGRENGGWGEESRKGRGRGTLMYSKISFKCRLLVSVLYIRTPFQPLPLTISLPTHPHHLPPSLFPSLHPTPSPHTPSPSPYTPSPSPFLHTFTISLPTYTLTISLHPLTLLDGVPHDVLPVLVPCRQILPSSGICAMMSSEKIGSRYSHCDCTWVENLCTLYRYNKHNWKA